jgi:hypothetical protein
MCDAKVTREPAGDEAKQERVGRPIEHRRIRAGTKVQISGMPFTLLDSVVVEGHPDNFARAAVDIVFPQPTSGPEPSYVGSLLGSTNRNRY